MGIDFDALFKKCEEVFSELDKNYKKGMRDYYGEKLKIMDTGSILNKIDKMLSSLSFCLYSPEDFQNTYLYVLCQLEALSALVWVLGMVPASVCGAEKNSGDDKL